MGIFTYFILSASVLFVSYRMGLFGSYGLAILVSTIFAIKRPHAPASEVIIFLLFINSIPIIAARFRADFEKSKEGLRSRLEEAKSAYEGLRQKDMQDVESNLEREKKLNQVLSLYEISKDMSGCLAFEDIFNIFSMTLKKSFRFRLSKLVLLKESGDIDSVYQIELGSRISKTAPDNFDREIAASTLETKKITAISQEETSQSAMKFSVIKDFAALVAIPIFSEEKIAAILYIENIPRIYFDNFIILSGQFAIQFQKVLLYKKVQEMAITDSLTEVSTRRYFFERSDAEIKRAMRHKQNISFLMLDLDHFKEKNDKFGHLVGDVILKEVASILKSNLREIDIIGRYGGEEFIIALSGLERQGAIQVAERIRQSIGSGIFKAYDETVSTTVSIGISVFPDNGVDINSLIESADKALYKAKETGRNKVC